MPSIEGPARPVPLALVARVAPLPAAAALAALIALIALIAFTACSDDDGGTGTTDAGASEASTDAAADSPTDAPAPRDANTEKPPVAIRCTDAEFDAPCAPPNGGACLASSETEITFNTGAAPTQYTNHCLKVKAGTVIVFSGSFFQHPLEPAGGDTPTPIPTVTPKSAADEPAKGDAGRPEVRVTTSTAGTFGFQCVYHPVQMFGAIRVVP